MTGLIYETLNSQMNAKVKGKFKETIRSVFEILESSLRGFSGNIGELSFNKNEYLVPSSILRTSINSPNMYSTMSGPADD
jgi:hypothetical protein